MGDDWRYHVALGDVNRDGYQDLAAIPRKGERPRVFLFEGGTRWRESSGGLEVNGVSCGGGPSLADLDGDGHLDLLVADHCSGLYLFVGDGAGGWTRSREAFSGLSVELGMNDIAVGDINLDGLPDVVGVTTFGRGFRVFRGEGEGRWKETDTNLPRIGGGYRVRLQDMNLDGRPDIVTSLQASTTDSGSGLGRVTSPLWINAGGHHWRPTGVFPDDLRAWEIEVGEPVPGGAWEVFLTGLGKRGGVHRLRWDPASELFSAEDTAWILPLGPEHSVTGLTLADFSGDGHKDLALARYREGTVHLFLGDGAGGWQECRLEGPAGEASGAPAWGLAASDLDGDGRMDLVLARGTEDTGELQVWMQR